MKKNQKIAKENFVKEFNGPPTICNLNPIQYFKGNHESNVVLGEEFLYIKYSVTLPCFFPLKNKTYMGKCAIYQGLN